MAKALRVVMVLLVSSFAGACGSSTEPTDGTGAAMANAETISCVLGEFTYGQWECYADNYGLLSFCTENSWSSDARGRDEARCPTSLLGGTPCPYGNQLYVSGGWAVMRFDEGGNAIWGQCGWDGIWIETPSTTSGVTATWAGDV